MKTIVGTFNEVLAERRRQDEKWGKQRHPDGTGSEEQVLHAIDVRERTEQKAELGVLTWADVFEEEAAEVLAESDQAKLRVELIQTAAVCLAWIEAIDERQESVLKLADPVRGPVDLAPGHLRCPPRGAAG